MLETIVVGMHFSVSFKVGRRSARVLSRPPRSRGWLPGRGASGVWQWCCAGSVTPSNGGLLIARNYLKGKFMIIRMCFTSSYCYKVKVFFFMTNDLLNQLLDVLNIFVRDTKNLFNQSHLPIFNCVFTQISTRRKKMNNCVCFLRTNRRTWLLLVHV